MIREVYIHFNNVQVSSCCSNIGQCWSVQIKPRPEWIICVKLTITTQPATMERIIVLLLAVCTVSTALEIDPDVEVFNVQDAMLNYGINSINVSLRMKD